MATSVHIRLNEIENVDRMNLAREINNVFGGRVPTNEVEFKGVVDDNRASAIVDSTVQAYKELGFDVLYNAHDLFVLYEEVMR